MPSEAWITAPPPARGYRYVMHQILAPGGEEVVIFVQEEIPPPPPPPSLFEQLKTEIDGMHGVLLSVIALLTAWKGAKKLMSGRKEKG